MIKSHPKIKNATFFCAKREGDNVWIGTSESGLILYSVKRNTLDVFNTNDGLPSNCILSVEIDNNNCLWIATDEGLCYFNPVTKVAITFITDNNSENGIFSYMGSTKRKDGTMIFATKQGAISFDPLKMFISPNRGKLAWTDLVIHNNTSNTRELSDILSLALNKSEEIDLNHNENSFSIHFQELNYSSNINTRYTYQLVGFDKDLSQLTNDGVASYYNLPPGKYHLEVRSYFADKEGNYEHRSIEIRVRQPWYNTFWAWCLWSLLIFTSAYFTYRYFKRRLERRYSEEKIRFFINVSHDMRTPITLIKAPLGDLLQNESLTPAVRYLANMISNNVNKLFEMINQILEFEQSDENEMVMNLQEMEVNHSVTETIENFASYAEAKNISFQSDLNFEPIDVVFDKKKLEMILDNLITNAIKYSYQGGNVLIRTGCTQKEWWIDVEDNGIGIPTLEQKNIFKRFFRAENAINSKQIGSGLGLLLANNLTRFLGGNITFQSEEGVRTIFKISFPLNSHSGIKSTAILPSESPFVNSANEIPAVLYVDDNDDLREYINARLGTEYRIFIAASAQAGLKILAENQINLVITDIMMPEINGFELCEKIKSNIRYSVIPVILLSALSDKKDIIKGLQIGADDYITKPFYSVFLKQRIDNLLENRKRLKTYFQNTETINTWEINEQSFVNELDKLFIEKLERSIDTNMSNPKFTIDTLSRDLGMSRTILYYRMKNLMNVVPNDYLRLRKLEKAAEFLKNPKYTIYDVAEMVGYADEKYFKSVFTKHFGYSPRKKPL
jgi:signal transduction histidine kinase/DNA-binding response OmpR family regulator